MDKNMVKDVAMFNNEELVKVCKDLKAYCEAGQKDMKVIYGEFTPPKEVHHIVDLYKDLIRTCNEFLMKNNENHVPRH